MASIRKYKGKSLVGFPHEYVLVDTETTGLSPGLDSIIEFGAVRYRNREVIDTFSTLVKPDSFYSESGTYGIAYISPFISNLTHITNEMLNTAPSMSSVLPDFLSFVKDSIIVGHNVNFDVNFIYDTSIKYEYTPFTNAFIDTLRLSKMLLPHMAHHRLQDLALLYGIDYSHAHRAIEDVYITEEVYKGLYDEMIDQFESEEIFNRYVKPSARIKTYEKGK